MSKRQKENDNRTHPNTRILTSLSPRLLRLNGNPRAQPEVHMTTGARWGSLESMVTGAASGPGGKHRTRKPSASDVAAKALPFITYARVNSLTKSPATGLCHSDKTLSLSSGLPAQHRCLHQPEAATTERPLAMCYWSAGSLVQHIWRC